MVDGQPCAAWSAHAPAMVIELEDEPEDGPPPSHDSAGLHIMASQCSTCIFRAGNLMQLRPGRMADLTAATDRADTNVICHQTLERPVGALCRGSVDRRMGQMARIAYALNAVVDDG